MKTTKIKYLDVHFDKRLADQRGTKERPEWNKKMSTCNAGEVKQRIWYLRITFTCTQLPDIILSQDASPVCQDS